MTKEEATTGLSLGFQPQVPIHKTTRPAGAVDRRCLAGHWINGISTHDLSPLQNLQPATRVQFGPGAILPHSNTPSLRVAGFEDDDEDEYEALVLPRYRHPHFYVSDGFINQLNRSLPMATLSGAAVCRLARAF
jgi:hypothetical protein